MEGEVLYTGNQALTLQRRSIQGWLTASRKGGRDKGGGGRYVTFS